MHNAMISPTVRQCHEDAEQGIICTANQEHVLIVCFTKSILIVYTRFISTNLICQMLNHQY